MKKKTTKQPELLKTVLVREVYVHKFVGKIQAVEVAVFIDYAAGTINLIEKTAQGYDVMKAKQWTFAGRGLEYMAGWYDIIDAMKEAVVVAEGRLKVYQKERELEVAMALSAV